MDFDVNVRERILKPVNEVFDAVVDPNKMSNYFISGASGPIKVGRVEWEFGDVGARVSIDVLEVEDNRKIVLESSALGRGFAQPSNSRQTVLTPQWLRSQNRRFP